MTVDLANVKTLRQAASLFFTQPGPRLIAKYAASAWAIRALLGPPKLSELPTAAAVIAWWPFQEWLAHRYLLHFEPRTILGRRIDPLFARRHRAHHRAPRELENTLLPIPLLRGAIPASALLFAAIGLGSPRRAATAAATYATMGLIYEWTHFLVHTSYRPRSPLYKRIRKNHHLHHFHNERYWLGFTFPLIDTLLKTDPTPRQVERSETARNLHGLVN